MLVKSLNRAGSILRPKHLGRSSGENALLGDGMVGYVVLVCIKLYTFIGNYDVDKPWRAADNFVSACASCHSTAQSPSAPMVQEGHLVKLKDGERKWIPKSDALTMTWCGGVV